MLKTFINIFRIRSCVTSSCLRWPCCASTASGSISAAGINQAELASTSRSRQGNRRAGRLIEYVGLFTGGNLGQATLFGLGIMPYISASIIFQLLTTVVPALEKLQKEGDRRQKINEWTRYATSGCASSRRWST